MTRSTGPATVQRVQSPRGKQASAAQTRKQVTRPSRKDRSNGKCRRRPLRHFQQCYRLNCLTVLLWVICVRSGTAPPSTSTSTQSTSTQSNPSIHFPSNQFYHTHTHHSPTHQLFSLKIVLILLFPLILFL